jgi:biopolymer transport protein ExbB
MGHAAERRRQRLTAFLLAGLVAFVLSWAALPLTPPARAQEPNPPAEGGAEQPKPKPADNKDQGPGFKEKMEHIFKSIGWFMGFVFVCLSISLIALIVLLAMDVRMSDSVPPAFVEEFTETVNKRRFKEAYELAKNDSSFLARVLSAGMARLQYGIEDARETAMNTVESIKASKEQFTTYLATIGTLGPLLGLVGTVYSMVGAFQEMSDPNKQVDAHRMANILSHGLVVTMVGIGIAVPAIFSHAFFRNRITRITMEVANVADDLLTQMFHNSKPRTGTPVADSRASTGAVKAAE